MPTSKTKRGQKNGGDSGNHYPMHNGRHLSTVEEEAASSDDSGDSVVVYDTSRF